MARRKASTNTEPPAVSPPPSTQSPPTAIPAASPVTTRSKSKLIQDSTPPQDDTEPPMDPLPDAAAEPVTCSTDDIFSGFTFGREYESENDERVIEEEEPYILGTDNSMTMDWFVATVNAIHADNATISSAPVDESSNEEEKKGSTDFSFKSPRKHRIDIFVDSGKSREDNMTLSNDLFHHSTPPHLQLEKETAEVVRQSLETSGNARPSLVKEEDEDEYNSHGKRPRYGPGPNSRPDPGLVAPDLTNAPEALIAGIEDLAQLEDIEAILVGVAHPDVEADPLVVDLITMNVVADPHHPVHPMTTDRRDVKGATIIPVPIIKANAALHPITTRTGSNLEGAILLRPGVKKSLLIAQSQKHKLEAMSPSLSLSNQRSLMILDTNSMQRQ
ncbi:hypothetical protein C8J56DRAFT_889511 [Mycena floridula]|nr:hypothetical protein C8J56DRAFT_889511 [Mycena floridula]